jgi:hypothetical protein
VRVCIVCERYDAAIKDVPIGRCAGRAEIARPLLQRRLTFYGLHDGSEILPLIHRAACTSDVLYLCDAKAFAYSRRNGGRRQETTPVLIA